MTNIICRLLGHKTTKDYNDSGYLICRRCGSHEYYHYDGAESLGFKPDMTWYYGGLLLRPCYFVKYRIKFAFRHFRLKYIDNSDLPF